MPWQSLDLQKQYFGEVQTYKNNTLASLGIAETILWRGSGPRGIGGVGGGV